MTQTMREQLQALVEKLKHEQWITGSSTVYDICGETIRKLESILVASQPAVSVKAGWVCKDKFGLWHYAVEPKWSGYWYGIRQRGLSYEQVRKVLTDPWPDKPNGGPECIMEIKP